MEVEVFPTLLSLPTVNNMAASKAESDIQQSAILNLSLKK